MNTIPDDLAIRARRVQLFSMPVGELLENGRPNGSVKYEITLWWVAYFDLLYMEAKLESDRGVGRRLAGWDSEVLRVEVVHGIDLASRVALEWIEDIVGRFDEFLVKIPGTLRLCDAWTQRDWPVRKVDADCHL